MRGRLAILSLLLKIASISDLFDLAKLLEESGASAALALASEDENARKALCEAVSRALGPSFNESEIRSVLGERHVVTIAILAALLMGKRFVNVISVRLSKLLELELEKSGDPDIVNASRALGISVEYSPRGCLLEEEEFIDDRGFIGKVCYRFRIKLPHYLIAARTLLSEPDWKLVSYPVHEGYVYLRDKRKVIRLLAERYKNVVLQKLLEIVNNPEAMEIVKDFANRWKEVFDSISKVLEAELTKRSITGNDGVMKGAGSPTPLPSLESVTSIDQLIEIASKAFPPCMQRLLNALLSGENLTHHERFALATFLINAGLDLELILDVFRHVPDFNEKIARYQIEHLAGLRGSRKKYMTYNCDTMKTLGICPGAECGVKNPLTYLRRRLRPKEPRKPSKSVAKSGA